MNKCPKCGGTSGFYTKGEYWHYYRNDGRPDGYDFVSESTTAICLDCGRRMKFTKIQGESKREKYRVGDAVFAIVKNAKFQLEVVEATIGSITDDEVRLFRPITRLTSDGWTFPKDALDREIFDSELLAVVALRKMQKGESV